MAAFQFRRRQTRRWWYAGATVMAAAFFAVFFVVGASANLSGSTFEGGDGNMVVNTAGNLDWANVPGIHTATDDPSGSADNSFGQGTKEDSPAVTVVSGSIPPNKNDLTHFMEASQVIGTGASQNVFLYLGWERLVNIGNANLDFEINKNATSGWTGSTTGPVTINRSAGDVLVTYDFGGSGTPTVGVNRWLLSASNPSGVPGFSTNVCFSSNTFPCWGDHKDMSAAGSAEGAVNTGTITDSVFGGSLGTGLFGETAINLTAAGVFPAGQCNSFGSTFLKSRSSSSFTAEIKDFIAPVPVNISNCGEIKIIKHTDPRGGNQAFSYTSNLPAGTKANVGGVNGVDGSGNFSLNDTGNTNSDSAANTVDEKGIQQGQYMVTESGPPGGYTFESLSCSGGSTSISGQTATINLAPNDVVTCTYTNQLNTSTESTQVSNAGPVTPGTAVHDTATVIGNQTSHTPSGTVEFFMCGPTQAAAGCSANGTDIGSGTLSGSGTTASADSPNVNTSGSPLLPGYYCFRAVWGGDTNYPAGNTEYGGSSGTNECFQVSKIPTTVVTAPSVGSGATVNFNSSVSDNATITASLAGGGPITGTITFYVCNPLQTVAGACPTSNTTVSSTSTLTDGGTDPATATASSSSITANMTGTWCFRAVFTPSGNTYTGHNGSTADDSTSDECFNVTDTFSATSTQSWVPNDSATVTSAHGAPLTGTLTIQLYTGTGCQAGNADANHVYTQTANGTSNTVSKTTTNTDVFNSSVSWKVTFTSSDPNVTGSSHCESSSLTVTN